ncbi:MAG TPA: ATP-binding protein [Candidatus Eisenbacteria bacterium]|nr:ATP-binding protein [Candidatus Eisenbacteria bacterium]
MVLRHLWLNLLERSWKGRSIVWLAGVRRVGKTWLCQSLPDIEYFDCELPRVRRMMLDPQGFLDGLGDKRIVLDEIHRLQNPSELLKIAADHYQSTHIVATGSSTLGASKKFRDTLAGRKKDLWLTPMCLPDLEDAKQTDLKHRFLRGGLPPFFLPEKLPERDFQEWMDAYWAKDIQELFRLERRDSFQRFTELVLAQSGGVFDATRFARPCEVSRPTITNYLRVLEATFVAHVIRPFSTRRPTEIVAAPKVYGFDTGFVCYYRGWQDLRDDDLGVLWEHFVLNEITARLQSRDVFYWRDKRGHEVDFVLATRRKEPMAIECKWSAANFDPTNLKAFRYQHPEGENVILANDVEHAFTRNFGELKVHFASLPSFATSLSSQLL